MAAGIWETSGTSLAIGAGELEIQLRVHIPHDLYFKKLLEVFQKSDIVKSMSI